MCSFERYILVSYNGFSKLEIEGDSTKKGSSLSSIMLLMEDNRRFFHNLNISNCCHFYREGNWTIDCLGKKCIYSTNSNIW